MDKVLFCLTLFLLIGISIEMPFEKGSYKQGTYYGIVNNGDENNTAIALVSVNSHGVIDDVFLDTTYVDDEIVTTRKTLNDTVLSETTENLVDTEWYQQVNLLENKVIEEQGLDWLIWSEEDNIGTDPMSGITIESDDLVEALNNALDQAK